MAAKEEAEEDEEAEEERLWAGHWGRLGERIRGGNELEQRIVD